MTAGALRHSALKELRALLPFWALCAAALIVAAILNDTWVFDLAVFVYGFGSLALGAQSIGHEQSHRTLSLLLSQPVSRRSLLLVKFGILILMLAALAVAATFVFFPAGYLWADTRLNGPRTLVLVVLGSAFVSPWLTMVTRNAVAAALFTFAIAAFLVIGIQFADFGLTGRWSSPDDEAIQLWFWRGMLLVSAVAAFGSWRTFERLEVFEGAGRELHVPSPFPSSRSRSAVERKHPLLQLLAKELHLQQMAFIVAILWMATIALVRALPYLRRDPATDIGLPLTMLFGLMIPVLTGALASAEERHYGTAQWQTLLPIAAWKQWALKSVVAFGLPMTLCLLLPILFVGLEPAATIGESRALSAIAILLLTSFSLYISSLSSSGVRALLIAMPTALGAALLIANVHDVVLRYMWRSAREWVPRVDLYTRLGALALSCAVLSGVLIYLAYVNHRSGERALAVLPRQIGGILAVVATLMVVGILTGGL